MSKKSFEKVPDEALAWQKLTFMVSVADLISRSMEPPVTIVVLCLSNLHLLRSLGSIIVQQTLDSQRSSLFMFIMVSKCFPINCIILMSHLAPYWICSFEPEHWTQVFIYPCDIFAKTPIQLQFNLTSFFCPKVVFCHKWFYWRKKFPPKICGQ